MAIKVVIDSASDVDAEEAREKGIILMPLEVRINGKEYLDGVDLSHRRFFEMLIESDELPKTSQINEYRFEECFSVHASANDQVIVITISSKLSGTYFCACKAAKKFEGVFVVDSLNACIGERLLLELCLKLIAQGKSAEEVVAVLEEKKRNIRLLALLGTLKYLEKGGRISKAKAIAGELLSIKPVISITEGEVKFEGKALGSKNGNNLLNRLIQSSGPIDFDMPYAVAYSGLEDSLLRKYLSDSAHLYEGKADNIPAYMIGSAIGTHVGPGAIAVSFFGGGAK